MVTWKTALFVILTMAILAYTAVLFTHESSSPPQTASNQATAPDYAQEIYSQIYCYCGCGGGMLLQECGCSHATEMKSYINNLIENEQPRLETLIAIVDKWGFENVAKQGVREEIKTALINRAPKNRPEIMVKPERYDLGKVSMDKGVVTRTFTVRNKGTEDLIIESIYTSCGCTTAQLVYDSEESPLFGMHGNSDEWFQTIPPGEKARLKVTFDPAHHGEEGIGPFTRFVLIESNDPVNKRLRIRIEGEVTSQ